MPMPRTAQEAYETIVSAQIYMIAQNLEFNELQPIRNQLSLIEGVIPASSEDTTALLDRHNFVRELQIRLEFTAKRSGIFEDALLDQIRDPRWPRQSRRGRPRPIAALTEV